VKPERKRDSDCWATACLRELAKRGDIARIGPVINGPTLAGITTAGPGNPQVPQWTYVSLRRVTLFLESSLEEGTQWVVFEPNTPALWGQIRLDVGAFMQSLFVQGTFQGTTPHQAYFVKCDAETNTAASVALGVVNIVVGFAPQYPAEFVTIQISQMMAGNPQPPDPS
jgi:phage tail sheath protein FI